MRSILQDKKECYITHNPFNLHEHHVFGGANRKLSEKYGLKIWLHAEWHNLSSKGIHFDKSFDREIKRMAQTKAMAYYGWTAEDFIKIFGRNYLC